MDKSTEPPTHYTRRTTLLQDFCPLIQKSTSNTAVGFVGQAHNLCFSSSQRCPMGLKFLLQALGGPIKFFPTKNLKKAKNLLVSLSRSGAKT